MTGAVEVRGIHHRAILSFQVSKPGVGHAQDLARIPKWKLGRVTPSKLAPLLVSIEDKGLTNDVVDSMHITTDSSWMGRSSVAVVESNKVTWNNTNGTDVGGEVGTDFMDMIDFSEVEEMHGGDNGTERNEVPVYSAPPILGCLNTSAQLPVMRLGGESEPIREHYWNQIGEQNLYNEAGVNDGEAYLDSGFSRSN
ncbi:early-responsive to dehydration stress protein ERD4 [Prunus dulcis]|uniref:Early-responsive to dehydration stress protein ERD4 n=1 Tax=Prunus dulcis TaxID=3755 RepID=A0A5H2XSC3_PRUDU|nr:early-responsive to dehydration stress protein ERD4 [Prunus dulcis]